jgi:hypothetical protein
MSEHITDAIRVAPPVGVVATTLAGLPLQEWVYILTAVYTILQIGISVWTFIKKNRDGRN